jgi:quercetin dioxygenase-like cupin family protein
MTASEGINVQNSQGRVVRRTIVAIVAALLVAVVSGGIAVAQQTPQQRNFSVPFRGVSAPGSTFDLVQSVIDYNAGAKTSAAATKVPSYLTVLDGELTIEVGGKSELVAKGKGLSVPAGATLATSNGSSGTARLFVSTLLAVGAVEDVHQPNSAGVKMFFNARRTMFGAPPTVDVIQQWAESDPGFRTPNHVMNEFHLFTMLAGVTDFGYLGDGVDRFVAPRQAVMGEGMPGWMANTGQEKASYVITWVAAPGKPLTSAVAAPATAATPAAPATGNVGFAKGGEGTSQAVLWLVGIAGLGAFALGVKRVAVVRKSR